MVDFRYRFSSMEPFEELLVPKVYGNTPTFLGVPLAKKKEDLKGADAAIIGGGLLSFGENPWRTGLGLTFYGPGERTIKIIDPALLRKASLKYCGFLPELGVDVFEHVKLVDYGDVTAISPIVTPEDEEIALERTVEKVSEVIEMNCMPIVIESNPYAIVKAISKHIKGKIGIITLDAHGDNVCPPPYVGWVDLVSKMDEVDMTKFVQIGMRGPRNFKRQLEWYREKGSHVYTYREIREMGMSAVIEEAIKTAYDGAESVFLNIDFDVLDLGAAPGLDEPLGITVEELLKLVLELGKRGVAAFNVEWIVRPTAPMFHIVTWTILYLLAGLAFKKIHGEK